MYSTVVSKVPVVPLHDSTETPQTASGEVTFTPRLVCADLKGSLGLLPRFGDLYDAPQANCCLRLKLPLATFDAESCGLKHLGLKQETG